MTAPEPSASGIRGRWNAIPRGLRATLIVAALFIMMISSVGIVDRATRGREPRSYDTRGSARSTATNGAKAFRLLLGRYDIRATDLAGPLRSATSRAHLPADATLIVVDAPFPSDRDRQAVADFATRGGRVIIAGTDAGDWLIQNRPRLTHANSGRSVVRFDRRYEVETKGTARWSTAGGPQLVVTRRQGSGRIILVADSSMFQNQLIARQDNAAFSLALVGDRHEVAFAEGLHGLSRATGWAAIPGGWKVAIIGSGLSLLLAATARGRRIGPVEPAGRSLDPPRRASADALAVALKRARRPDAALEDLRAITRYRVLARGGDAIAAGYTAPEAAALVGPLTEKSSIIALGRAFARSQRGTP